MTRPIIALSLAIAASVVVSGCAYLINHWPHQLNSAPASRQYRSRRTVTHESLGASDETTTPVSEASPSPSTAPGSPAGLGEVKPTVTIGSDENDRIEAERLLKDTDARLARVDRAHQSVEDAANYRQAAEFSRSAHSALASAARLSRSFESGEEGVCSD
jgi:hypothetical protein